MRPVNLIPPEDRRGEHAPLRAGVASYAIIAALGLALIGVVLVVLTSNEIGDKEAELASLEARQAAAAAEALELAPYGAFASLEQSRSETVATLAQSRFDWERVLKELALVIPRRVTLESLTGTVGAGVSVASETAAPSTTATSIAGPSLQIIGCARGQKGTARLLAALKDIDGVTRVGMESSELGEESATTQPSGEPAAPTEDTTTSCQTRPSVAKFQVTVAFDAVEVSAAPAAPGTAPAPVATTPPATTTTTTTTTETATPEQQAAADSAAAQVAEARDAATPTGASSP